MKSKPLSFAGTILLVFFCTYTQAQSFGTNASAVWITDCNQSNFFNTSGNAADLIGPSGNVFNNSNLGVHTQNSATLILGGAQVKTFKNPVSSNVCGVQMYYRVYLQSGVPGAFSSISLPFLEDCSGGIFPSGGTCQAGDQKWEQIAPVNLTGHTPGNYVLEVYYEVTGSNTSTTLCTDLVTLNNSGNNYKAFFSIQSPNLSSTNPSSCFGNQGSITIGGLVSGASYQLTYSDDGVTVGPDTYIVNGAGQLIIPSLNKGFYSNFSLLINGCTTDLFTGIILSDPVFVPTFPAIPPFCAGTTAPLLPATSINGLTGTWSPTTINNQSTGTYTFTPNNNQCAVPSTITVTVIQRTTPAFSFGTSLTICGNGSVPTLPNTSTNGINGTWSPSTVSNQTSGTYTFTPNSGQCANPATFTVTVNPNITPIFDFGNSLTVCAGGSVPTLSATSTNGIIGTWNPSVANNQNSGTYTFTPNAGQCAITTTFTVTVTPNVTPTFSFGTSLIICGSGSVPTLTTVSTEAITGTWNPSVVDNQNSGTYTFTPDAGQCATTTTFTVTVNPNITPTFSFGTSLTICGNGSVPTLTTTSTNGITGTWNPAVVDNQNSGTYIFTPTAGLCATTTTFTVTVNPNITPTFSFGTSLMICAGRNVPTLFTGSSNGITGTWSPSVVNNQNSGTYTFTPTAGQCATTTTFTVTVNPNIPPTFSFGTSLTICAGGIVPTLPTTSTNGLVGTWSPSVVDNQNSGTYTFTPDGWQCSMPFTFTVTVNPNITPTFSFGTSLTICSGGNVPALSTTSTNGITGTWSPSTVDNQNSGIYIFSPTAGLCATTATFTVTVNPNITPTFSFGTSETICAGGNVPTLTTTSTNGITGTWSPSAVDNQNSGTYTFTPTAGLCAITTTFAVTISPNITPTFSFGTSLTICAGENVPTLTTTSTNNITGTWNPAVVDDQNSGTYIFTPTAGLCATTTTFTVTVNPNITPTFSFGTTLTICAGGTVPTLYSPSDNGITGTWSPSTVDNQNSGVYTFTPTAGQCAVPTTFTVTVNPNITPTFSFGTTLTICAGGTVPTLYSPSDNGITGTWSSSAVDNQNSGVYTFTPTAGQCALPTTFTVTVNPNITPTFSFGTTLTICAGGTVPTLYSPSDNGITGTWSPSAVDNQNSGTYTFTPTAGLCATTATFVVTVNPNITPTFDFGTSLTICAGGNVPTLPTISTNGITGTWNPAIIDNQNSGSYIFTPNAGQCVIPVTVTFDITVTTNIIPTFSFGNSLSICTGGTVPALPPTSTNAITGTWSPSTVSDQSSGTYTFTPTASGQCVTTFVFTVTVNAIVTPTFSFGTSQSVCIGTAVPPLPAISLNGIGGTWSPLTVNDQTSGTYTFTPDAGQCANSTIFTYEVNPVPTVTIRTDTTVYDGDILPVYNFINTPGSVVTWTNNNTSIGLAASGTGSVPSFTAVNMGNTPVTATITVTPKINGCSGTAQSYVITVLPKFKEVFVPNVFSPNGDGKNDMLYVYGNYIAKVDMHIFNQWGQQIATVNNRTEGWDGRSNGNPQPVGVYVYVLKAVLTNGKTVNLKGSITLVR